MAATASESDLSLTPTWTRSSFSKSFKRKAGKKKGSDAGSVASSNGASPAAGGEGSPYLLRNSTDSGRKLSIRLGRRRGSKNPLGRTESESGSSDVVSRTPTETTTEGPNTGGEEDSNEYYTEEEEET